MDTQKRRTTNVRLPDPVGQKAKPGGNVSINAAKPKEGFRKLMGKPVK
jgi:hypothetical protein